MHNIISMVGNYKITLSTKNNKAKVLLDHEFHNKFKLIKNKYINIRYQFLFYTKNYLVIQMKILLINIIKRKQK
jgi:hypothetical protein